jgi:hypothetical protein
MLGGFLARDILILRGVLVAGQAVVAIYAAQLGVFPIAGWNTLFAAINSVWVVIILRERRRAQIPREWQPIYRAHFAAMTPMEFLKWWRLGQWDALRDASLTREGASPALLYFILGGTVEVRRANSTITRLTTGSFVGEMSLVTGRPANADVAAVGEVHVQQWTRVDLDALRVRDLVLWTKVQSAIGTDLVEKIQRGDARLTEM